MIHVHFYVMGRPASIYKTGYKLHQEKTHVVAKVSICFHPVGHEIITHTLSRPPTNERALFHKPVLQRCQSHIHSGTGYYIIAYHSRYALNLIVCTLTRILWNLMLTKISKLKLSYLTKSCRHALSPNEKILRHIYFFVAFCNNGDQQPEPC